MDGFMMLRLNQILTPCLISASRMFIRAVLSCPPNPKGLPDAVRNEKAKQLGIPRAYLFQDMLHQADIDVVHICTPNFLHYSQAKAVMEAEKHVICEKPLALTIEEAEDLVEQIAGVSKTAIHEHEEAAELAMPFMFISILLSAAALFLNKRNHKWASMVTILLLVSSALSCIHSLRAGWLGGKIRHQTEINAGTSTASPGIHAEEKERE